MAKSRVPATENAAPIAVPESLAAGWTKIRSNDVSRRIRPFATAFSATPPARQSRGRFVRCQTASASRSRCSSSTTCSEAATSSWCEVRSPSGSRAGPSSSSSFGENSRPTVGEPERHVNSCGCSWCVK